MATLTEQSHFLRGYASLVPADDARTAELTGALERTCSALGRLEPFAPSDERADLVHLREDCEATLGFVRGATAGLPLCKVELLRSIAPYLERLPRRIESNLAKTTSQGRFEQLARLLYALRSADGAHGAHPAALLAICDQVLDEVRAEERARSRVVQLFSHSDLARALEPTVRRQWTPILVDARLAISRLGSAALLLGATAVVGRLALLYPVVHVGSVVVDIANKLNPDAYGGRGRGRGGALAQQLDAADALRLAKALLLLWAATKVLAAVALYVSVGYSCLAAGVGCLAITHRGDDVLLKGIAPVLAPVAAPIADLLAQVARHERSAGVASARGGRAAAIATPVAPPLVETAAVALVCPKCTFENASHRTTCEMCDLAL